MWTSVQGHTQRLSRPLRIVITRVISLQTRAALDGCCSLAFALWNAGVRDSVRPVCTHQAHKLQKREAFVRLAMGIYRWKPCAEGTRG